MEMKAADICKEYREAKDKKNQIIILADQNCCEKEEIMKILLDNGEELPRELQKCRKIQPKEKDAGNIGPGAQKALEGEQAKPQSMPDAVMIALCARMDELDAAITVLEKEYKEIAAFVGHYSGEIRTRTA